MSSVRRAETGCGVVSFLRAGSSVVERSIAARMVTGLIPVSRFFLLFPVSTKAHVVMRACLFVGCDVNEWLQHPCALIPRVLVSWWSSPFAFVGSACFAAACYLRLLSLDEQVKWIEHASSRTFSAC